MASSREAKRAEKEKKKAEKEQKKKAKGPGTFAQMKQVFTMTKKTDPNIVWYMLLGSSLTFLVFLLIGLLTGNWITWVIIGLPFALLVAVIILSRRAERAAFAQIEGQPGAAGAALGSLRRGWIVEQEPVQMNPRSKALLFRALGKPGLVLVSEGSKNQVDPLIAQEKKRLRRVLPSVPVHVIYSGNGQGQTPLKDISKQMKKLPKSLTQQEVHQVNNRVSTLGNAKLGIPKGVDPQRVRPDHRAMRGR